MNVKERVQFLSDLFYIPDMKSFLLFFVLSIPGFVTAQENTIKLSNEVELIRINQSVYIHKTLTDSETYGRFTSNGVIYIRNEEALIADTPIDTSHAKLIINWLKDQNITIKAVVVNHHHHDALGSLSSFHKANILSYGFAKTSDLAIQNGLEPPTHLFSDSVTIVVGDSKVTAYFFGEGHTVDNIALWIPKEHTLFGGCLIKSVRAGKGNLEDANIGEWSNTVSRIKKYFDNIETVIPGHGIYGGTELLDYTIEMFSN